ncbi:hypothetical protein HPB50_012164 [Hyalomma asiaticum]|uniref:Uncharacterized protein n=1 Tax=Hyalomma asiaticum TaxID=266040 RepID=A0ACB7TH02_HYAAI|nr:hypothetical protein HPB50_012164 [Hyalomma asiaticum]
MVIAGVERWVSDQLHCVLGLSDPCVAQFLINMAQKSTSRQDLIEKIRDTGTISVNDDVVPHKEQCEKPAQAHECAVCEVLEQNAKYTLLADSDDEALHTIATVKEKTSKKRHLRQKADDESDDERPTASSSGEVVKVKQEPNWDSDPEDEQLQGLKEHRGFARKPLTQVAWFKVEGPLLGSQTTGGLQAQIQNPMAIDVTLMRGSLLQDLLLLSPSTSALCYFLFFLHWRGLF